MTARQEAGNSAQILESPDVPRAMHPSTRFRRCALRRSQSFRARAAPRSSEQD
jgi:hypothetical protein